MEDVEEGEEQGYEVQSGEKEEVDEEGEGVCCCYFYDSNEFLFSPAIKCFAFMPTCD